MKNYLILFLFAALATSCAFLESWFGPAIEVLKDPAVTSAGGGVVRNLISGNYIGALASLGELVAAVGFTWKGVNMQRDGRRRKGIDVQPDTTPAEPRPPIAPVPT